MDSNNGRPRGESAAVEANFNTPSVTAGSADFRTPTKDQSDLLQMLGRGATERLSISHRPPGGVFYSEITTAQEAPSLVAQYRDMDCWYGTGVLAATIPRGRGTGADVIGIRELFADLDVKPGGLSSFMAANSVIQELSALLGTRPVAIVATGRGVQPHWPLRRDPGTEWTASDTAARRTAAGILRRWGRLVQAVAERHGGSVDNVYDLARIMRAPGTTNCKGTPLGVTLERTGGCEVGLAELESTLDKEGIGSYAEDVDELDAVVSVPSSWTFGDSTCRYVQEMVKGWQSDKPPHRHAWLVGQSVRLACAHRRGCLAQEQLQAAEQCLEDLFGTRLNVGNKRSATPGEVRAALSWGRVKASTLSEDYVRRELGDHTHPGDRTPPAALPYVSLEAVHEVFSRWFGKGYDLEALDAVLAATAAGLHLPGDAANLLIVGGPSGAKTETLSPLEAAGVLVTSTIASEGALLSGTSAKERGSAATGGLLRRLGDNGILAIKDVTSILSMNRDSQSSVLAALREVSDGYWQRNLGVDGGTSLTWKGRCTVLGAVTTVWDQHYAVVAAMGDRFLLVRMRTDDYEATARQAVANAGDEVAMRTELRKAVGGLLQHVPGPKETEPGPSDLAAVATLVTWARTAVITDGKGNVLDAHAREAPARLTKQLLQLYRGSRLLGRDNVASEQLVLRVVETPSRPPRLRLLLVLPNADEAPLTTSEVVTLVNRPRTSVDRELQALQALGLVTVSEERRQATFTNRTGTTVWKWSLPKQVPVDVLGLLTGEVS